MQENYKILGLSENCTDEELDEAYLRLRNKYLKERFYEGEIGNDAARNLTKVENAYSEIIESRKSREREDNKSSQNLTEAESLIKEGKLTEAQSILDNIFDRDAEWHYLQSIIFYKKNWTNESLKQLEIAKTMEPTSAKYADSYDKLKNKMNERNKQFHSGNANDIPNSHERQMGGDGINDCLECCATWACINMCCNCCR